MHLLRVAELAASPPTTTVTSTISRHVDSTATEVIPPPQASARGLNSLVRASFVSKNNAGGLVRWLPPRRPDPEPIPMPVSSRPSVEGRTPGSIAR